MIIDYNKLLQENIKIKIDQTDLYNLRKYKCFKRLFTRKYKTFIKIKIDQTDLYNLRKYKCFKRLFTRKYKTFASFQENSTIKSIFEHINFIEKEIEKKGKIETILNYLDIDLALKLVFKKDIKLEKEIIKLININKKLKEQLKIKNI